MSKCPLLLLQPIPPNVQRGRIEVLYEYLFGWSMVFVKMLEGDISSPSTLPSCAPLVQSDNWHAIFVHVPILCTVPMYVYFRGGEE